MSHFASTSWNNPCGLVSSLDKAANSAKTASGTTATEGTNQLTYTTLRAGMYRVCSYLRVSTASTANTSHTIGAVVTYNNGSAISASAIPGAVSAGTAATTVSQKGTAGTTFLEQTATIYCASGTDIVLAVAEVVSGTGSGAYDIHFTIEAV